MDVNELPVAGKDHEAITSIPHSQMLYNYF
jgi:hypothetical protein